MKKKLRSLLRTALNRIEITQSATASDNIHQSIQVLLIADESLRKVTEEIISASTTSELVFQQVTDWLQDLDPRSLSPEHAALAAAWLRKVVALNHIRMARKWSSDRHFSMYMMDTSFIDQPQGAWTTIGEFVDVVKADGEVASSILSLGRTDPVIRVFFVPSGEYILACSEYINSTIREQVSRNIAVCVSRADLADADQPGLVGDGFCVANRIACEIAAPHSNGPKVEQRSSLLDVHDGHVIHRSTSGGMDHDWRVCRCS